MRTRQTWVMSFLYIGTFGSFIGYSFALPLVIKTTFPDFLIDHPFIATYLAGLGFVGALIGSLSRPLGGWLADRIGGARVTLGRLHRRGDLHRHGHQRCAEPELRPVLRFLHGDLPAGRGGQRLDLQDDPEHLRHPRAPGGGEEGSRARRQTAINFKQQAAAVIGIAGAIGAFGGFLIQVVLRQANLDVAALVKAAKTPAEKIAVAAQHADWSIPALQVFLVSYVVFALTTWFVYLRKSCAAGRRRHLTCPRPTERRRPALPRRALRRGCVGSDA